MDKDSKGAVLVSDPKIDEVSQSSQSANRPQKDIWDKMGAVAPIISGLLIFVMGGYFTYSYNQQQLRVQEIQTIEKFIPHLMGNDQSKRAAILAISSLTNAELAGKFAQIFASQGTVSALQSMAETGSDSDRSAASTALAKALENIAARESKLNEMETAFQQALNEKSVQGPPVQDSANQVDEAERLERLADMCRARGQTPVAESLLKQAVNLRIRVQLPNDAKDVVASLKKLADVQQAAGNKDEADNTNKKISMLEAKFGLPSQPNQAALLAPPPPPAHDVTAPGKSAAVKAEKAESEVTKEKEAHEAAESAEGKSEKESVSAEHEHANAAGESGSANTNAGKAANFENEPGHAAAVPGRTEAK